MIKRSKLFFGRMSMALSKKRLFWIWNDENIRRYSYILPLPVISHHLGQTTMSLAIGRGRVHAVSNISQFRLLNGVSICNDINVTSTSGFRPPSWILHTRSYINIIVLHNYVNLRSCVTVGRKRSNIRSSVQCTDR